MRGTFFFAVFCTGVVSYVTRGIFIFYFPKTIPMGFRFSLLFAKMKKRNIF
ncbi:hypothetical protein EXN66_Car019423 [Channa argus]|uniref:Uncharacterized protein n=1 Tax=Channa argus TaxID=215402 RepID=A0A6G1QMF9_CHAAH|nr:hypothetical protein EXN66_Car019423 [Channa argus]